MQPNQSLHRFWKFVSSDFRSVLSHPKSELRPLLYVPGTVVSCDATPNPCRARIPGIVALPFPSEGPFDRNVNPTFGPRAVELAVREEDVVWRCENGVVRARRAEVVKELEIEEWMKTGNGEPGWTELYRRWETR